MITEGSAIQIVVDVNRSTNPTNLNLHASDADGDTLSWNISLDAGHGVASASGSGLVRQLEFIKYP